MQLSKRKHVFFFMTTFVFIFSLVAAIVYSGLDLTVTNFEEDVDYWASSQYENDGGENDYAEISGDLCRVTCTDEKTGTKYTLSAELQAKVIDGGTDETTVQYKVEYMDTITNEPETVFHYNKDFSTVEKRWYTRGAIIRFFPWYDESDRILTNDFTMNYWDFDTANVLDAYSVVGLSPFFPLLFNSEHEFKQNDDSNWLYTKYNHKINYDPCKGKYLEIIVCADDYGNPNCEFYYGNTAVAVCFIHDADNPLDENGDGIVHIRSVDTHDER